MRGFLTILIFPVLFFHVSAQDIRIINSTTDEPIANAAIYNQDQSRSIISNEKGIASLGSFNDEDTLYFQHTAFLPYRCTYRHALQSRTIRLTRKVVFVPEFVISASKLEETQREVSHLVDVITPQKLELLTAQTSADILSSTGNIYVQKSQGGGGSPVLRGFEANKILLVIDGVRMNNAIYRGGHLQNSITLDPSILEKTEIVYGPHAIIYGSDALGGVIHYITRDPELAVGEEKSVVHANAYAQLATANHSWKTHLDFNIGSSKLASLTSLSYSDYGDIRMGSRRDPYLGDYGKCFQYIEPVNGSDSIRDNDNPLIQKYTGYSQFDLLQKFRYKPTQKLDIIANLQYSTSSDIPRYDMLNDEDDEGVLKYAQWYYGPQNRLLASLKTRYEANTPLFDKLTSVAAYQNIQESRISRKFRDPEAIHQEEGLNIYSLSLDMIKNLWSNHSLVYGAEANYNQVESNAYTQDIYTQERQPALTRYPDDGSKTASYAAYTALKSHLGSHFILTLGSRYNFNQLNAAYSEFAQDLPFETLKIARSAFTGSLGGIYLPTESMKLNLLLSTGYRIPNLDDMAKIRAKGNQITFPNPRVDPEYTYNVEFGLSKTFDGYIQINGTYYLSYLTDVIVRVPYTFEDGADTMLYNGDYLEAFVNDNSDRGLIHGFSMNLVSDLNSNISFRGTLNYTWGRDLSNDVPLAHIPPIFGKADFIYETKKFTHELYFIYSGWKRLEDMSVTGEDNEEEGTPYGFPGWYTFNLRTTWRMNKIISLQFALENVIDNFYKPFASSVAAPGINFITTLRVKI